jgi:hypothetical protein
MSFLYSVYIIYIIMKKAFFVSLLFIRSVLFAQTDPSLNLPQLLPPTPDAAQLVKVGLGSINKSSGAAQVALPLYELNVGGVKLPITLNYLSQGNKVEELCSRVGYGWVLNAGGAVTRSVMGMPDEKAPRLATPADLNANTQEVLTYFENGKVRSSSLLGAFDTQPDEFYFNFNGHSGKFILNDAGTPEIITHENLKIDVRTVGQDIEEIFITTPDGVTYIFGSDNNFERAQSDGIYKGAVIPKTTFLLTGIHLTTGDYVQFNYTPIQTKVHTGFTETVSTPGTSSSDGGGCVSEGHYIEWHNWSFQEVKYNACYLSSIKTSTNVQVNFSYEPMPDNSGDVRLTSFAVANQNGRTVCGYNFNYLNYNGVVNTYPVGPATSSPGPNGRFYLTKLYQTHYKEGSVTPEILSYDFDYYGNASSGFQPQGNVYSQDHFGFANGANNQSLIPRPAAPDDFDAGFYWADRTPNASYSIQGVLKKITYPTNGTEEFFYEPNTVMRMEEAPPVPAYFSVDGQGKGTSSYGAVNSTTTDDFTVYRDQDVFVNYDAHVGSSTCSEPCGGCKSFYCKIIDVTTGASLQNFTMLGLTPQSFTLHLIGNHTYEVTLSMTGPSCFYGSMEINYDKGLPDLVPLNKVTGGVRVNRVVRTDAVTGKANNTFFYYSALASLGISSGEGALVGSYQTSYRTSYCEGMACFQCTHNSYMSNGVYNLFRLDHSHVYYKSIIQADDAAFANGGTEYTYFEPDFGDNGAALRGTELPFAPDKVMPDFNGMLQRTTVFDNNKQPKTIEENEYGYVRSDNVVRSIYIRKNYDYTYVVSPPSDVPFQPFDVREVDYVPGWLQLTTQKKTEYSDPQHSLVTLTTFKYGSLQNVLPASVTTTNSKGEDIRIDRTYPTDYIGDPVLTAMQQNHNIAPVVEEHKYKVQGNIELEAIKTIYKDWYNDATVIAPQVIQQKQNNVTNAQLEDRIVFAGYDSKGNVGEVAKSQGHPITYLWDYKQSVLTAEVKNAHASQVAYTSFEGDNKGGWDYTDQANQPAWAPTGSKMFDLSVGTVGKTGLDAGVSYIVSYWSNGAPAVINGTTAVAGRQVKGWTFYQHTLSGITDITVTGTSGIDELRLYPQGALMTTFTHEPLVGVTSKCDADNRINYYEYDDLNRLLRIRDIDNNILKQFDYQYKVEISLAAQWQVTGVTRCAPCPQNSNYLSGTQEHEEKDINTNSPTYNQTRWVNDGVTGACVVQPDWQLTGNTTCRQILNAGLYVNTGFQLQEKRDVNPCSATYNSTRWDSTINCNVCPKPAKWQQTGNTTCEKDANGQNTGNENVEYKDMEPCSATAGATKWVAYLAGPTSPCYKYVCTTGNCTGAGYKCVNGKCEMGVPACFSSRRTKINGVLKYENTYKLWYSDCTWGDLWEVDYDDGPDVVKTCP